MKKNYYFMLVFSKQALLLLRIKKQRDKMNRFSFTYYFYYFYFSNKVKREFVCIR